jgi:hypothetical protein
MLAATLLSALLLSPAAHAWEEGDPEPDGGYYLGARSGVAVPIGAQGIGFPVSIEAGIHFENNFALGVRVSYQYNPPSLFGIETPPQAVGPLLDVRHFFRVRKTVDIYPVLGGGFVFGVSEENNENIVLPILTVGLGSRLGLGSSPLYLAPEVGVNNFAIPYMGVAIGMFERPGSSSK